jgi:hypothetical protein
MKTGKNAPCSCGSGEKFKRCCGKIVAIVPVSHSTTNPNKRECGNCSACCDGWLTGTVYGHEMKPGTPCHFVRQGGCSIYERRPELPCREFVCGWMKPNNPFPESFRPDRLGVIIQPIEWHGRSALRLCSAGREPDAALLQWMADFSRKTDIPFFYEDGGQTTGFGSSAFIEELSLSMQRGESLWEKP